MKHTNKRTYVIATCCALIFAVSCVTMSACSSVQNDEERGTSSTISTASNSSESSLVVPAEETEFVTSEGVSVTPQEAASSGGNNGGNSGGSTATTPTTSSSTTPTQPSNPTTSTPATPSTPTTSTPSTTPSTPSQSTPDPEPTPEPTPEPDPEPVRERTIDPQYICDQVNARMKDIGMQNTVDALMGVGLSKDEALTEIHSGGWYTITRSLYENNNDWQINSTMESLTDQHNQNNIQYAWMEVQCYLDPSYNEVSNIDDAEYVRFVIYR